MVSMEKDNVYVLFEEIKNKIEMINGKFVWRNQEQDWDDKREVGTEDQNTNWQTGRRSDSDMRKAYSPT